MIIYTWNPKMPIHTVCNITHTPRKAMDIQVHDAPAREYNNFQSLTGMGKWC